MAASASQSVVSTGGWTFYPRATNPCPTVATLGLPTSGPAVTGPPLSLRATVTGNNVRLDWNPPPGEVVTGYLVEAGSGPGLTNFGVFGFAAPFAIAMNVPNNVYSYASEGSGAQWVRRQTKSSSECPSRVSRCLALRLDSRPPYLETT